MAPVSEKLPAGQGMVVSVRLPLTLLMNVYEGGKVETVAWHWVNLGSLLMSKVIVGHGIEKRSWNVQKWWCSLRFDPVCHDLSHL